MRNEPHLHDLENPLWLGHGLYFFQDAPFLASAWAQKRGDELDENAVVIKASIDIGDAIDLIDGIYWPLLKYIFADENLRGARPKLQVGPGAMFRRLKRYEYEKMYLNFEDHYYISKMVKHLSIHRKISAIRACFMRGPEVYINSWFREKSNVQVCVLDPDIISDVTIFKVRSVGSIDPYPAQELADLLHR